MVKLNDGTLIADDQYDLINPCTEKIPSSFKNVDDYSIYILWSIKQVFKDNLFFHRIPELFKVYSDKRLPSEKPLNVYFNIVDPQGDIIYDHTLNKSIDLVSLDSKSNISVLKATFIEQNHTDLVTAIDDGHITPILDHLCELGYDGCIIEATHDSPYLIHLCHPDKQLSVGRPTKLI